MNPDLAPEDFGEIPTLTELNKFYDKIDVNANPPQYNVGDKLIFKTGGNRKWVKVLPTNRDNIKLKIMLGENGIDMSFYKSSFDEGTGQSLYKFNPEKWLASQPEKMAMYLNQEVLGNQLDTGNLMDLDEFVSGIKHEPNNDQVDMKAVGLYKDFLGLDKPGGGGYAGGKRKSRKSRNSKKSKKSRKSRKQRK